MNAEQNRVMVFKLRVMIVLIILTGILSLLISIDYLFKKWAFALDV